MSAWKRPKTEWRWHQGTRRLELLKTFPVDGPAYPAPWVLVERDGMLRLGLTKPATGATIPA